MGLAIEGVRYFLAVYALGLSAFGFYVIYLATQTNFINDPKWADQHTLKPDQLAPMRALRDTTYNTSMFLVVFNLAIIVYLIFSKVRIGTRF